MIPAAKGDKLTDFITSQWYNDVSKTASRLGILPGTNRAESSVKFKCLADVEIPRFYPASISGPMLDISSANLQWNTVSCRVTGTLDNYWGVVQGPVSTLIASDYVLTGLTWAYIQVTDTGHTHVTRSGNNLVSGTSGRARIVHKETGSTPYYTYALIDISPTPETSAETIAATFELTANLARTLGATATAEIIDTTDPDLGIGDPITVVNTGEFKSYTGCQGMAIKLNTGVWWIVHVDQHAILWQAVLSADTHDFSLGGGNVPGAVSAQDTITYSSKFAYTDYPFSYLPADPITIDNPSNFIGKSGDTILIAFDPNTDDNNVVAVFPAQSRRFMFELTADRGTGLTGNTAAAGYQALGTGGGDIPTTFNVADTFYLAHNAKDGDQGICEWDYNLEAWHIVAIKHTATLVKGTLNGSFSATPSTFSVTVVAGLNGVSPSSPITVQNRFSWEAGTTGHNILVGWDNIAGEWYPIQMRCPT